MMTRTGVKAEEYQPPRPWKQVYFSMAKRPGYTATTRIAGSLTDRELEWVARVITAELMRRKGVKLVEKSA